MNETVFLEKFSGIFETPPGPLSLDTKFWDLPQWDSLVALSLLTLVAEDYGIQISGAELQKSQTIGELWAAVSKKLDAK